jgi:hypothetical protein
LPQPEDIFDERTSKWNYKCDVYMNDKKVSNGDAPLPASP